MSDLETVWFSFSGAMSVPARRRAGETDHEFALRVWKESDDLAMAEALDVDDWQVGDES